ncbi:MAG TPA: hypothetical protein VE999_10520 [Gemmataceae bacterium]|nr:hypothetical protein [Gemmataceae bacterium]
MQRFTRYGLFFSALGATTLLAVSVRRQGADPTTSIRPIHDWDIADLAVHLNRMGVEVRLRAVPRNGTLNRMAFLTSTSKEWEDLNALNKDVRRIQEWRGTLYCEWVGENDVSYLFGQWGDHCLLVRPFVFYGDVELLERVRTALAPFAQSDGP